MNNKSSSENSFSNILESSDEEAAMSANSYEEYNELNNSSYNNCCLASGLSENKITKITNNKTRKLSKNSNKQKNKNKANLNTNVNSNSLIILNNSIKTLNALDVPSLITDSIYQGNYISAKNKENLFKLGITHIVVAGKLEIYHPNEFTYKLYEVDDIYSENLYKYFEDCYKFIDECIYKKKEKVLVHCAAGISRSSAFVLSYIIKKYKLSFDNAFRVLKKARPEVNPNAGFQMQLCDWYDREVRGNEY